MRREKGPRFSVGPHDAGEMQARLRGIPRMEDGPLGSEFVKRPSCEREEISGKDSGDRRRENIADIDGAARDKIVKV